jgi:hypothetical protein
MININIIRWFRSDDFVYFGAFRWSDPKPTLYFVSGPAHSTGLWFWLTTFAGSRAAQPTKSISTMFTTSPLTPASPAWSSYDSHSPSFDGGDNLNEYNQKTALIARQRDGYSFSHSPSVSIRSSDTKQLSWWRAGVRNALMKSLVHESRILGTMQVRRTHSLMANCPP